jgi:hypothetical protein
VFWLVGIFLLTWGNSKKPQESAAWDLINTFMLASDFGLVNFVRSQLFP